LREFLHCGIIGPDTREIGKRLGRARETAKAEDVMRHAVVSAQKHFDGMYNA
jgi:hypothetical protein